MMVRSRVVLLLRRWRFLVLFLSCVLLISTWTSNVEARPGGGGSYSGGGSSSYSSSGSSYSSSGGSYGGDGEMSPEMLVIMIVVFLVLWGVGAMVDSAKSIQFDSAAMIVRDQNRTRLSAIRQKDENFSEVVFGDFLYGLVSRAYSSSSTELAALAPYLSTSVRNHLAALRGPVSVQVVIGSISDTKVELPDNASLHGDNYYVEVEVELNLISSGKTRYVKESWSLFRKAGVPSRTPERAQIYNCPNCAAVFQSVDDRTCGHCQEQVSLGHKDWFLNSVRTMSMQTQSGGVGGYSVEVGTDWHTNFDMYVAQWLVNLRAETGFVDATFVARCGMIFDRMNTAWSEDKLDTVRGLVSDGIYSYLDHGLAPYRSAKLKNVIQDAQVDGYEIAKVTRDAYYDAVVIRIWASGIDYTVYKETNRHYSGDMFTPRKYSEYWTMIRGRGVNNKIGVEAQCPNCGAALSISMSGNCEFCEAHVSSGEFDWVLGKIEQDEAYLG